MGVGSSSLSGDDNDNRLALEEQTVMIMMIMIIDWTLAPLLFPEFTGCQESRSQSLFMDSIWMVLVGSHLVRRVLKGH